MSVLTQAERDALIDDAQYLTEGESLSIAAQMNSEHEFVVNDPPLSGTGAKVPISTWVNDCNRTDQDDVDDINGGQIFISVNLGGDPGD